MTVSIVGCQFCGKDHGKLCPAVKAIEYNEHGGIKRVEFMTPADYLAPISPSSLPIGPITFNPGPITYNPLVGPYVGPNVSHTFGTSDMLRDGG